MADTLMSSTEVAALLGVTTTTVKRWADAGLLACVKTVGGHRRFESAVVERFRLVQGGTAAAAGEGVDRWIDTLVGGTAPQGVEALLLRARATRGSWFSVATELTPVLAEIGARWKSGALSVLDEHLASERLARATSRLCEWLPSAPDSPRALLATAEGDDHTLGLSLVELCLRELGWRTLWAGRRTPIGQIEGAIARRQADLVGLSASISSSDAPSLAAQARRVGRACAPQGTLLLLGGSGAWPEQPSYGHRVRDFARLRTLVTPSSPVARGN